MSKRNDTVGSFLNVDVELTSPRELKTLAREVEKWILYSGRTNNGWLLTFETNSYADKSTPDGVIAKLCKLIENLSHSAQREWRAAKSRVFDIGFECSEAEKTKTVVVRSSISEDSLRRISALGAKLDITCYRHFDETSLPQKK